VVVVMVILAILELALELVPVEAGILPQQ